MSNTTPNLSTLGNQTPSNQTLTRSTNPPSAVAVTQSQSEVEEMPGINALLSANDDVHDHVGTGPEFMYILRGASTSFSQRTIMAN